MAAPVIRAIIRGCRHRRSGHGRCRHGGAGGSRHRRRHRRVASKMSSSNSGRSGIVTASVTRFALAQHREIELLAGLVGTQDAQRVRAVIGLAPVDGLDHVAVFELERVVLRRLHHQHAFVRAEIRAEFRRDARELHAAELVRGRTPRKCRTIGMLHAPIGAVAHAAIGRPSRAACTLNTRFSGRSRSSAAPPRRGPCSCRRASRAPSLSAPASRCASGRPARGRRYRCRRSACRRARR